MRGVKKTDSFSSTHSQDKKQWVHVKKTGHSI